MTFLTKTTGDSEKSNQIQFAAPATPVPST